jgi:glycyl-tRNA synthetase beta chain
LPYFITFSNIESRDPEVIRRGNERVIRPRLADAEFFWTQDRKKTLESRIPALSGITFQKTLGSLLDKTQRVQRLAAHIAQALHIESAKVERAARLAKADLLTEMVAEFPNLQGTMGRYYALAEGEPEEIAAAIEEQYLPKVSGGALPATLSGQILALADKIDTLCGIFSVGLIPTGDRDPYGLRRAAFGAVRICIEKELDVSMPALLDFATAQLNHSFDREATLRSVHEFILERLKSYLLEHDYAADEIESVLAVEPPALPDFVRRVAAVKTFRSLEASASLAAANKRIRNILRKAGEEVVGNVDTSLLAAAEERSLFAAIRQAKEDVLPRLQQGDYAAALCRLASLREAVDAFFDHVLVMAEDAALRQNRLGLLAMIEDLFLEIADISKLQSAG